VQLLKNKGGAAREGTACTAKQAGQKNKVEVECMDKVQVFGEPSEDQTIRASRTSDELVDTFIVRTRTSRSSTM
jgi:hypothetical protein